MYVFLTGPQTQSRRPHLLERGGVLYGPVVKESLRSCAMLNTYIYVYVDLGHRFVFDLVLGVGRTLVIGVAVVVCLVLAPWYCSWFYPWSCLLLALFSVVVRGWVLCLVLGLFLGLAIALGVVVALVRVRVLDACFVQHAFPILVDINFSAVLRSSQYCGSVRSSCDILLDKSSRT